MRWFFGVDEGKIVIEGEPINSRKFVHVGRFTLDEQDECAAFMREHSVPYDDSKGDIILVRSSFNWPGDNGLPKDYDVSTWIGQAFAKAERS